MSEHKVPFWSSFLRSQMGSLLASATDISSLFILTEFIGFYYLVSTAIASGLGAIVGFLILRYWAFKRTDKSWGLQALKYGIASIVILLCNVAGMYLLTDGMNIQYMYSKLIISILIGVLISFPIFRYWVYK